MQAFKVAERNAQDAINRAIGMGKVANVALNSNVVEDVEDQEVVETPRTMSCPEDMKFHFHDHMAFATRTFWKYPSKTKEQNNQRNNSSGYKGSGPRTRA
jgi:hypothetical protein